MVAHARRQRLRKLMIEHDLTYAHVGELTGRTAGYIRELWLGNHEVAEPLLRLLELELEHGRGRELLESRATG